MRYVTLYNNFCLLFRKGRLVFSDYLFHRRNTKQETNTRTDRHNLSPILCVCPLSSSFSFFTFWIHRGKKPPTYSIHFLPATVCGSIKCNFFPNWVLMTQDPLGAFQSLHNEPLKIIKWPHPILSKENGRYFPETALNVLKVMWRDRLQLYVSVLTVSML